MKHRYMVIMAMRDGTVYEDRYYNIEYACEHFRVDAIGNDQCIHAELVNIEHPNNDRTLREYSRFDNRPEQ